jgi:hypothetical protein
MLHSSALDDHHAIPTTAAITRAAHEQGINGYRLFPSAGLSVAQIGAAIQRLGLSPIVMRGDVKGAAFSPKRLATTLTAFIRSGYPVLLAVEMRSGEPRSVGQHAVCVTGFRPAPIDGLESGGQVHMDGDVVVFYLHDDNLGPNVRFMMAEESVGGEPCAVLVPASPVPRTAEPYADNPTPSYPRLVPNTIVVAVHEGLRTTTDEIQKRGEKLVGVTSEFLVRRGFGGVQWGMRFVRLQDYLSFMLRDILGDNSDRLGRVRLALVQEVAPMSLHLALVYLCVGSEQFPLVDVLYDTTELEPRAFAHVVFAQPLVSFFERAKLDLGVLIDAT